MFDLKAIVAGRTLWLGEPDLDVSRAKGHDQTKKGLILGCIESLPRLEFGRRLRLVVLTGILRTRPTISQMLTLSFFFSRLSQLGWPVRGSLTKQKVLLQIGKLGLHYLQDRKSVQPPSHWN